MPAGQTYSSRIAIAVGFLVMAFPAFAASSDHCKVLVDPTQKGSTGPEVLPRCNGVLKPSQVADPDIVIPAPTIDDPLAIHPKKVPGAPAGQKDRKSVV